MNREIYVKIYTDEEGSVVFEAAPNEGGGLYLYHAKKIVDKAGRVRYHEPFTSVYGLGLIAISPEARAILEARLADTASYDTSTAEGDLEILLPEEVEGGYKNGYFAFKPTEGALRRVLRAGERFTLKDAFLYSPKAWDMMTEMENEALRTLVL